MVDSYKAGPPMLGGSEWPTLGRIRKGCEVKPLHDSSAFEEEHACVAEVVQLGKLDDPNVMGAFMTAPAPPSSRRTACALRTASPRPPSGRNSRSEARRALSA